MFGSVANTRIATYVIAALVLTLGPLSLHGTGWRGGVQLHTIMEIVATLLASIVGAMALVRYYSKKDVVILFIGAGFLGTAFLDGYHAVVTSEIFRPYMPSDLPSLIPWSWVASRQFLSVLMFFNWLAWLVEYKKLWGYRIKEREVYIFTAVFTLASFLFFAFASLPRAYYDEYFFHRPEEFAPALFFLLALAGYLYKGGWKQDSFEHWLVLSLIVGFIGQAVFMSHSGRLFDYEFDLAHTMKKVSYICVLTGLLISMYGVFKREQGSSQRVRAVVDNIIDGIVTINERGSIQSVNAAAENIFGYTAEALVGQNVKMLANEPHRGVHDGYLTAYLATGEAKTIGTGRDVEGIRRNGEVFPLHLAVTEMWLGGERLFLGILRDLIPTAVIIDLCAPNLSIRWT
jgi:PAS domain S-box-containing protein